MDVNVIKLLIILINKFLHNIPYEVDMFMYIGVKIYYCNIMLLVSLE